MRSSLITDIETKIVRKRWKVGIWDGLSAWSIAETLKQIPPDSKVVDYEDDESGDRYIVFECETKSA